MIRKRVHSIITWATIVLAAATLVSGVVSAQEVLPTPPAPFKGQIGLSAKDSKPDFPQPVQAPKGAPNIVLVLLDDVGFGASSTFGGPYQTPTLDRLAKSGLRYTQFHTTALCSPTRAALLTGRNHHSAHTGYCHGDRHRLSRLRQPDGQGHGHRCRDSQAEGLEHRLVRQEPQRARLAEQPGRAVRPVADRSGLRALLWVHRRRNQPVAAGGLRRHQAHRALPRQPGLQLRLRHRRPGDQVGAQPEGRRAGPAVLPLLRARGHALPASPEEGMDRQIQGPVRPGLGPGARGDARAAEETRPRAGQHAVDQAPRGDPGLGLPQCGAEAALSPT